MKKISFRKWSLVSATALLIGLTLFVGACREDEPESGQTPAADATDPGEPDVQSGPPEESEPACLPADEGEPCGACGATVCVDGELECADPGVNACGGCGTLPGVVGDACVVGGEPGVWVCDGDAGTARCEADPVTNACGGTADLAGAPGSPCGPCGDGQWACDGAEDVRCSGAGEPNACGGCGDLEDEPGEPCGCGGEWLCDGADEVICDGSDASNACGGCAPLAREPGTQCLSACGEGEWLCDGPDGLVCDAPEENACGGCGALVSAPGSPCSTACGEGEWVCDGSAGVSCDAPETNACGGCGPLPDVVGDSCGCGGTQTCLGGELVCFGGAEGNACGGCAPLAREPGSQCLSLCGEGEWLCDGPDGLVCDAPGENACGGCEPLPAAPGEPCGVCGTAAWLCSGDGGLACDALPLEEDPANCGSCGTVCGNGTVCSGGACVCPPGSVPGESGCEPELRLPVLETGAATEVTSGAARLNGTLADLGAPPATQVGFCAVEGLQDPSPGSPSTFCVVVSEDPEEGPFSRVLEGLSAGTLYSFRAFARQESGTIVYGQTNTFGTALP